MAVIATAEVRVVADTSRFLSNLRRQLRGAFSQVGAQSGQQFTRAFNQNVGTQLTRGLRRSGQQAGNAFTNGLRTAFSRVGAAIVGARVTQAFSQALAPAVQSVQRAFARLRWGRLGQGIGSLFGRGIASGVDDETQRRGRSIGARFGASLFRGMIVGIGALGRALSAISIGPLLGLAGAIRDMTSEMVDEIGIFIAMVGLLESLAGLLFALPAAANVAALGIATIVVGFRGFGSALSAAYEDLAAFEEAIEDLAPAAQSVAREFRDIAPALTQLRLDTQEALFRQLDGVITDIAANLLGPMSQGLSLAGAALGNLVAEVGRFFAESATADTTLAVFETVALLFDAMAASAQPFLEGMRNLVDEFLPRLTGLAEPLAQIGERFREWTERMVDSGRAAELFDHAVRTFNNLIGVVSELARVFREIFDAAAISGVDALGGLVDGLAAVADGFATFEGESALVDIFQALSVIIPIFAQFMATLLVQFGSLAPLMAQIAQAIGPALMSVIEGLGAGVRAMGPGLVSAFEGIAAAAEAIGPALVPLGRAIGSVMSAIAPILPVVGQLIAIVIELGAEILTVLASAITPIVEALAGALAPILPQIADLFSRLVEAVAPVIEALGTGLASVIETLLPPILELALALADALMPVIEALVPVLIPIIEIFFQLVEIIGSLLVPVIALLLPIIEALAPIFELVALVLAPLLELFSAILEPITVLIGLIASLLTPVIEFLAEIIGAVISAALVPLTIAFEFLADILADHVIPWFNASVAVLKIFWETAIEPLIEWIRTLASVVDERFGDIRTTASTVMSAVGSSISGAIDWVSDFAADVTKFLDDAGTVLDNFASAVDDALSNVADFFANAASAISSSVDSIIGWVENAINTVSNFSLGDLNPFADGGIVYGPTAALIGEAGKEVVIPMTRPQRAAELAQKSGLIDMLAARGALGDNTASSPSGPVVGEMHVHSQVADAEQVARRAIRVVERHMSGRGLERIS